MKLRRRKPRARVEMLPLMDIVFLLLVFFIYAMLSMALHRGMRLNLPESSTAEIERQSVAAVSLTAEGTLFLDEKNVSVEELLELLRLKRQMEAHPDEMLVQLFADGDVSYQELYRLLDQIKAAGISRISLQARQMGDRSATGAAEPRAQAASLERGGVSVP